MAKYFLTYLQRIGDDYLRWAHCDDKTGYVDDHGHGSFADAADAAGSARTIMVVAGTELLLEEASVPIANLSKAHKAVPYVLEEQLAQDVEASHFAFGSRLPEGNIPVAVIARASLGWIIDQCQEYGLKPVEVIPECHALPIDPHQWSVMTNSGHAAIRFDATRGFSCDVDMLPLLLENTPGVDAREQIWNATHFSCGADRYDLDTKNPPVQMRSEIQLFAHGLKGKKSNQRINLLQGDFGKRKGIEKNWKPWLTPAVLGTMLLGLWGGSSWLEYQSLGAQQRQLGSDIEATLKKTFPDVRRVVNPVAQMKTRLKTLNGKGIDNGSFVSMMSAMGDALSEADKPSVRSMNFGRGKLVVEVDAASLQDLDKIKSRLEVDRKLAAKVQSANKDKDRIRARLRVESQT